MNKADKTAPVGYYTEAHIHADGAVIFHKDIVRITDKGNGDVKAHYFRPGHTRWAALLWSCAPRRAYDKVKPCGSFATQWRRYDTLEDAVAACGLTEALAAVG